MEPVESVEPVSRRQPEETVRPLGNRIHGDGWVGVNAQTMRGGFGRGQQAEGKHDAGYETAHGLFVWQFPIVCLVIVWLVIVLLVAQGLLHAALKLVSPS